jgi:hypothetical protein
LARDARKRGELARCPAPSSRARGLWDSLDAPTKLPEFFAAFGVANA